MIMTEYKVEKDLRYLQLLAHSYPNIAKASSEIINLQAILNLPKGTEHFLADIHGEYEAFQHIIKNASGNIRRKVNDIFGNELRETEKRELCTLIYYPEQKLELVKSSEDAIDEWYFIVLNRLVRVCREVSSKYTRSKVHKALPEEFSYIIQELLHERTDDPNKAAYFNGIISTIISTGRAAHFIIALCNVIQRLAIDYLHILGDIYDRGPGAHIIMDMMAQYENWDIQWGNHDVLWMGAGAGNDACICNVVRIALRYANLTTLQEGYGINLTPLATFAMETYADDPCEEFVPKLQGADTHLDANAIRLTALMHKAISVIQFKKESEIIQRHPEWKMNDRLLLHNVDYKRGVCTLNGQEYEMKSCHFPTIDSSDPYKLTPAEDRLMQHLHHCFLVSEKLQKHIRLLLSHGCMYAIYNNNLLFHASVPLTDDGKLKRVELYGGKRYEGMQLMHNTGMLLRSAFQNDTNPDEKQYATDYFLYLWCGPDSILFDKSKMATFERYFLKDKSTHKEEKGNYFRLRDSEDVCNYILDSFGIKDTNRHIINGHVPVHAAEGENPIKASGKLMVIDGGFSEAYHKETGIAGYTLVYHSRGFELVQHEPFCSTADAISRGQDIKSTRQIVKMVDRRMLVADTDQGKELKQQVEDLTALLYAYRHGLIKQILP